MCSQKYACHCCGYKVLDEEPLGTFEVCDICYWEDDRLQLANPDSPGGANPVSLRQAQQNFRAFGACAPEYTSYVRKPSSCDARDATWQPLPDHAS
jgi:Cysteine-rich CPCC